MTQAESPTQAPRRWKKRVVIPGALLGFLAVVCVWAAVRGTWADTQKRTPASSANGLIVQLYRRPDGDKIVRCAAVFDHPIDAVWSVVTDYDHFSEVFPRIRSARATREPDGRFHLVATARAGLFGDWPFESHVQHDESPDGRVVRWDESSPDIVVNRGSWTLTRLDDRRTLVVYLLDVQLRRYPAFFVRDILLSQTPRIVTELADAVRRRQAAKP